MLRWNESKANALLVVLQQHALEHGGIIIANNIIGECVKNISYLRNTAVITPLKSSGGVKCYEQKNKASWHSIN